jgi:hypothetical protein
MEGLAFGAQQSFFMRRVRDHALPVVRAAVIGDLRRTIQNAHVRIGGRQGQGPPHGLRRDGIVVEIETHVDGLAGLDLHDPIRMERMEGSGSKRGCSSASAWATVREPSSGQRRWCATSFRHRSAWRLHSSSVVKVRPAQNESRTKRIALSPRPF